MKFSKLTLTALACATLLVACGGGGGGGGSTAPAPTPETPVLSTSNIVTSVAAPTYAANSEESIAFNIINAERSHCGFGSLAQNAQLDVAALNHANYQILNNQRGHYETSGLPGFTGVYPADRVLAAGYAASIGSYGQASEITTVVPSTNVLLGAGTRATRGLLSAPYHLMGSFRGYKEIGVSFVLASTLVPTANYVLPNFNFATPVSSSPQLPGSADVLTYPCQDSTGINFQLSANELPAPVAGRNLVVQPVGHPIVVLVRNGNTLGITSATLIKVSTGAAVALRAPYTKASDVANSSFFYDNEGFVLPDVPLEPSTQYQATINGTNNGAAFSRTFTFTTGTGG